MGRLGAGDELLLLQVVPTPPTLGALDMAFDEVDTTGAQSYLDEIAQRLQERGPKVRTLARVGEARETVVSVAAGEKAALIVLASHGRTGLQRWLLGSVAEAVTRHAPCPVWLVRCSDPGQQEPWKATAPAISSILLPLDISERADRAVDYVLATIPKATAKLVLLAATNMAWVGRTDSAGDIVNEVRAALDERAARLRAEGWAVDVVIDPGLPAEAILDNAAKLGVDLIALTSHGRTGAERWFLGSVAEKVVRHAACPVVVVRSA